MQICIEDTERLAEVYCTCRFPMPALCTLCEGKHKTKEGPVHFVLPLSAAEIINSAERFDELQTRVRMIALANVDLEQNFQRIEDCEKQVEITYQQLKTDLDVAKTTYITDLRNLKAILKAEIDSAVTKTRDHALEGESYHPERHLEQLIWTHDPTLPTLFQYDIKVTPELFGHIVQVAFSTTVAELQDLNVQKRDSPIALLSKEVEELRQEIDYFHDQLQLQTNRLFQMREEKEKLQTDLQDMIQGRDLDYQQATGLQIDIDLLTKEVEGLRLRNEDYSGQLQTQTNLLFQTTQEKEKLQIELLKLTQSKDLECLQATTLSSDFDSLKDQLLVAKQEIAALESELGAQPPRRVVEESKAEDMRNFYQKDETPAEQLILIAVSEDQITTFDISSHQWLPSSPLPPSLSPDWSSASTVTEKGEVFICGGNRAPVSAALILKDGQTRKLEEMHTGRWGAGVVYDPATPGVYVFGGRDQASVPQHSSERYNLSILQQRESLPDMLDGRSFFNPCLYSAVIYLCGGYRNSVEEYSLRNNTFSLLPNFVLPDTTGCTAVVVSGSLVVITEHHTCTWNLQNEGLETQAHPWYQPYSTCSPVVWNEVVYTVDLSDIKMCRGINIRTGEVQSF